MSKRTLLYAILTMLLVTSAGCAMLDSDEAIAVSSSPNSTTVHQPVFLEPVFVLEGLQELPRGIDLFALHMGVGAIFLDLIDEGDDGLIYANQTPFQLHFDIENGQVVAQGPTMTLPQGGSYQISLQIEPQALLADRSEESLRSLEGDDEEEASLIVSGTVSDSSWTDDEDTEEPIPDTWHPEGFEEVHQLRRTSERIPFTFHSTRMVRFTIDDINLTGGTSIELIMQLQVGAWVVETIEPALDNALGNMSGQPVGDDAIEGRDIDLNEQLDEMGDGIDRLIGDIDVEIR